MDGRATGFCRGCVSAKVALVHREVLRAAQVPSMSNGLVAGSTGVAVAAIAAGQMRAAQVARESAGMLHDAPPTTQATGIASQCQRYSSQSSYTIYIQ